MRAIFEAMPYEYLIYYAELVYSIEDPEGYKHEDLISEMLRIDDLDDEDMY